MPSEIELVSVFKSSETFQVLEKKTSLLIQIITVFLLRKYVISQQGNGQLKTLFGGNTCSPRINNECTSLLP